MNREEFEKLVEDGTVFIVDGFKVKEYGVVEKYLQRNLIKLSNGEVDCSTLSITRNFHYTEVFTCKYDALQFVKLKLQTKITSVEKEISKSSFEENREPILGEMLYRSCFNGYKEYKVTSVTCADGLYGVNAIDHCGNGFYSPITSFKKKSIVMKELVNDDTLRLVKFITTT